MSSEPKINCRSFRFRLTGSGVRHIVIIDLGYVYKFRENCSRDSNVLRTKNKDFKRLTTLKANASSDNTFERSTHCEQTS
jgi:hypothetical protein